ncbi:unnamed protein product [Cuscuta campestris]|uniref:LOB domain-containing protein n=2 Tax=Cuscuta sect. Cleistogrammica TaxID=1824901 RepID=A0A484N0M9_9ASTE|nr:hypothetical protein DM860_016658 [Cuscuta australis]VFQ94630.1 unnamed protein product [Cuscuta campestris]
MSSSSGSSSNGAAAGVGPCGACKFLRRKCVAGCVFAPYFDPEQGPAVFAAVHRVFGASNVSKLLSHLPPHNRLHAVLTVCFEAQARLRDPVYGCVSHIFAYQQQVANLQAELSYLQAHLEALQVSTPPPAPPQSASAAYTIPDQLPTASACICDLSSLFDPTAQQPRQNLGGAAAGDPAEYMASSSSSSTANAGVLQEVTRHLMHRRH